MAEGDDKRLNDLAQKRIEGLPRRLWTDTEPVSKYIRFRKLRMDMHELAQYARLNNLQQLRYQARKGDDKERFQRDFKEILGDNPWHERTEFDANPYRHNWHSPALEAYLDIDRDTGLFRITGWDPLNALVGVEAGRLRECKICQRIFWARQDNMVACTSQCSATNRQRLLRKNRRLYQASADNKKRQKKAASKRRK